MSNDNLTFRLQCDRTCKISDTERLDAILEELPRCDVGKVFDSPYGMVLLIRQLQSCDTCGNLQIHRDYKPINRAWLYEYGGEAVIDYPEQERDLP